MRWYILFPGEAYAYGPIQARSETEARQWVREWLGGWLHKELRRLPKGTQVWRA